MIHQTKRANTEYTGVVVGDDKYEIRLYEDGRMLCCRYGELWQDVTGNKMPYCLASELDDARKELARFY